MKPPPFLAHLRTNARGRPVPYINRWGGEDVNRLSIRHDGYVDRPGVFLDDSAQPEPDFFAQEMSRQRQCMAGGLCQVCGRPVPWSRRVLLVSSMSTEQITMHGKPFVVVTEPWLDERCAEFALTVCPALIRRRTAEDLVAVQVKSKRQVQLVVSTGWVDGPLEAESRRVMPAMWVKALVANVVAVSA